MADDRTLWRSDIRPDMQPLVSLASIEAAALALPAGFRNSPVLRWDDGAWLKLENVQPTGSFKIRGAWTKISRAFTTGMTGGVVAYSSGNHGIAVAHAARLCGAKATIVVAADAPGPKADAIVLEGADLLQCAGGSEERRLLAEAIAAETGQMLVPPYNDPDVIAGQGTIGLELLQQITDLSAVVVPIGGGGLVSGIAAAIKATSPSVRVVGVEPELASDAREALATGSPVQWAAEEVGQTIADGVRTQSLGPLNFAHVISLVDEIVTVSDEDIIDTTIALARGRHLIVEPSGAVAAAAVRNGSVRPEGSVAIVSGGNASSEFLARMLRGMDEIDKSVQTLAGQGCTGASRSLCA